MMDIGANAQARRSDHKVVSASTAPAAGSGNLGHIQGQLRKPSCSLLHMQAESVFGHNTQDLKALMPSELGRARHFFVVVGMILHLNLSTPFASLYWCCFFIIQGHSMLQAADPVAAVICCWCTLETWEKQIPLLTDPPFCLSQNFSFPFKIFPVMKAHTISLG